MKLMILHLSDIHFEKVDNLSKQNINGIVNSLKTMGEFTSVLVIVSGDITYSGQKPQYEIAWKMYVNIRNEIKEKYKINDVKIFIVPGNHDVDYLKGNLLHIDLQEIAKNKSYEEKLNEEYIKMNAFYNHANGIQCFSSKKRSVCLKHIEYEDSSIQINLINTASFSILEEDQGFHYLSNEDLLLLEDEVRSDFVISVMHHPHHWFCADIKKRLESDLYEKSDIILVGHEHYSSTLDVGMKQSKVKIYAGGELCNRGNWDNSEYFVGILDTKKRLYSVSNFVWNPSAKIYVKKEVEKTVLPKSKNNKYGLIPKKEYMENLLCDSKYMISKDISDYYVFPRLEEEVIQEKRMGKEPSEIDQFVKEIQNKNRIIVMGRNDFGKTALIKQLFKELVTYNCVIYLSGSDLNGVGYERTIKNAFEDIYTTDDLKYNMFKQLDAKEKILIIDDADEVSDSIFSTFLDEAEREFGSIIYTCGKLIEFDMKERIKRGVLEENYTRYRMQPFYKDKRRELITKIVKIIISQDDNAQQNIIELLCSALDKQKNLFRMDPDFIVQFTKYYCNNIGETIQNDGEIFSKVFEANIVSLIKPFASKMSVDKILIILDKIAYQMHTQKIYPMDQDKIFEVVKKYNEDFDSKVDYADFLNILIKSKVFDKVETKYFFCEKNYLAYFVAREIKRKCLEEQDYYEFNKTIDYACFGINAEILLFVTYITDNINLIRMIMDNAESYTSDWEEFDLDHIKIPYLSDMGQLQVKTIEVEDKINSEKQEIEQEKKAEKSKNDEYLNIYAFEENELNLMNKMLRALSILVILSRTLPSFEHMMKKEDKEKCVKIIYSLPSKIFNVWATEVENSKKELIDEIKEIHEWDYRKEKYAEDHEIVNFLRWESISLLMEMMNTSIGNASKSNTYRFLDTFNYNDKLSYKIEHLMGLDKRDSVSEFMKEAEEIFMNAKQQLPKIMVQRATKHYILSSKNINRNNVQRLNSKLWDGKLNQAGLIISKNRQKNKEE